MEPSRRNQWQAAANRPHTARPRHVRRARDAEGAERVPRAHEKWIEDHAEVIGTRLNFCNGIREKSLRKPLNASVAQWIEQRFGRG